VIREAGRVPAERTTLYQLRKVYDGAEPDEKTPLDDVKDAEAAFGSYQSLTQSAAFRFVKLSRRPAADRGNGTD
jgi:hypothetical protein